MFRVLLRPRWIAGAVLAIAAAAVMVILGNWQHDRYAERSAVNSRIDAGAGGSARPVTDLLPRAAGPGTAGSAPAPDAASARVSMTGRYDAGNEVLVRGRTVAGRPGYEVVTPLLLANGGAVLVDRGWVPPAPTGATAIPAFPAAPVGAVSVVGRVHLSESRGGPVDRREGRLHTRRIDVARIARELPYPVYGAYVLLAEQQPPADQAFVAIPVVYERAWQNGGYAVQWWLLAAMTLVGYGWLAHREAHPQARGRPALGKPAGTDARPTDDERSRLGTLS